MDNLDPQPFNLPEAVLAHAEELRRILGPKISLQIDGASKKRIVRLCPGQIELILNALALDARDSMPDGGLFSFNFQSVTLDPSQAKRLNLKAGTFVNMTVQNSYIGMAQSSSRESSNPTPRSNPKDWTSSASIESFALMPVKFASLTNSANTLHSRSFSLSSSHRNKSSIVNRKSSLPIHNSAMSLNNSDDSTDTTTHLSDAELHDVVIITSATNEAEALYLMTRLEDSGIPVLRTADAVNYHNPIKTPEIRVPRVLVARAQEIIDTARQEAKARALEDAFDVDEVDEKDAKKDPLIRTMAQLESLPHDQKLPELALYIIEWFAAGRSNADIARYLSLAGLTPDEARTLVADVYENQRERIRQKRESNASTGTLFTALGVLLFLGGYLGDSTDLQTRRITRVLRFAGIASLIFGVSKLATSKTPSRLEEPMPKDPTESEKSTP